MSMLAAVNTPLGHAGVGARFKTAKIPDELAAGGYRNDRGAIHSAKSVRACAGAAEGFKAAGHRLECRDQLS